MPESLNPFKRIRYYLLAKKIHNDMGDILINLKNFLENRKNIYGITIRLLKVTDTILVATNYASNTYPSTTTIYDLIKNLTEYISAKGAKTTNYPMLSITGNGGLFKTMVAIPVNKITLENNTFLYKRMVPGKILVTEVTGGVHTTAHALKQLETYIEDHNLQSPAIPFESLITDRSKEADTGRWVTKIYYPIF
jgi:effector-binding domain-containing protein